MIEQLLRDEWRLPTFRSLSASVAMHWRAHLVFGLLFTWLAGAGRYWDSPRAELWQYLGLGSVFVLLSWLSIILASLLVIAYATLVYRARHKA